MAYTPSLEDIQELTSNPSGSSSGGGYQPTFEDIPSVAPSAPKVNASSPTNAIDMEKMPWLFRKMLELGPSMQRPLSQSIPENVENLGRGFTETGQGIKQTLLGAGENLGLAQPGSQEAYTRGTELERKGFESTPAARDPLGKDIRAGVKDAPFYALTSIPALGEAGILKKILLSGLGGGEAKNIEYRQPGEDRGYETVKGIGEGMALGALPEAPEVGFKIKDAITGAKIPQLQKVMEEAQARHEAAQIAEQEAKSQAKQSPLKKTDYDIMTSDLNANNQKLEDINSQLAAQNENEPNPSQYFVDTPKEAETRLAKANDTHQAAKETVADLKAQEEKLGEMSKPETDKANEALAKAEKDIGEHVKSGEEHEVKGAKLLGEDLEKNRQEISKEFDDLEESTSKQNVEIAPESTKTAEEITAELRKLVSEGKSDSKAATKLLEQLDNLGKKETIAANDYIATYRSVNGYLREAKEKAYEPGLNTEIQAQWRETAKELEAQLSKMDGVLEKSLKPEDYKLFKGSANRWRTEVVPLYGNKVYRGLKIRKGNQPKDKREAKGTLPDNVMKKLAGDDEGNVLIRNAIQNNPETLKHVVGQKYDAPKGRDLIHNPNEQVAAYTSKMPELQNLIRERQNAQAGQQAVSQKYSQQSAAIKDAQEKAKAMQERAKKHVDMQKEAKTRADKMRSDYETRIENIKSMKEQKSSLEETNKLLTEHITKLKEAAENVNLTKKQHEEAVAALDKATKKRQNVISKLKALGWLTLGGATVNKLSKAGKAVSSIASLGEE